MVLGLVVCEGAYKSIDKDQCIWSNIFGIRNTLTNVTLTQALWSEGHDHVRDAFFILRSFFER